MTSEPWIPEPPPERGHSHPIPPPIDCPDCGHLWPSSEPQCPNCHLDVDDLVAAHETLARLQKGTR